LLFQKNDKIKKLGFIMWPAADAFNNNFTATPNYILSKLKESKSYSFNNTLNAYLKNVWSVLAAPFTSLSGRQNPANA
jgi:hypothetical protein